MAPTTRSKTAPQRAQETRQRQILLRQQALQRELQARAQAEQQAANRRRQAAQANLNPLILPGVPAEIRLKIYNLFLPERIICTRAKCRRCRIVHAGTPLEWRTDKSGVAALNHLMATCSSLYNEIMPLIIARMQLSTKQPTDVVDFISTYPMLRAALPYVSMCAHCILKSSVVQKQTTIAAVASLDNLEELHLSSLHHTPANNPNVAILDRECLKLLKALRSACPKLERVEVRNRGPKYFDVRLCTVSAKPKADYTSCLDLAVEAQKRKDDIRYGRYADFTKRATETLAVERARLVAAGRRPYAFPNDDSRDSVSSSSYANQVFNVVLTGAFVNQLLTSAN